MPHFMLCAHNIFNRRSTVLHQKMLPAFRKGEESVNFLNLKAVYALVLTTISLPVNDLHIYHWTSGPVMLNVLLDRKITGTMAWAQCQSQALHCSIRREPLQVFLPITIVNQPYPQHTHDRIVKISHLRQNCMNCYYELVGTFQAALCSWPVLWSD